MVDAAVFSFLGCNTVADVAAGDGMVDDVGGVMQILAGAALLIVTCCFYY